MFSSINNTTLSRKSIKNLIGEVEYFIMTIELAFILINIDILILLICFFNTDDVLAVETIFFQ